MSPPTRPILPPNYISVQEAAKYLCLSRITLDNWRAAGKGPPYARLGRRVVYRLDCLNAWVTERTVVTEAQ